MHLLPPLPSSFVHRKQKILSSISAPSESYTDASPKGSIDTAIIPLIQQINALPGLVTTSSCAGRISVFLEGRKGEAAVGGKGAGGRWLFVSHDPMDPEGGAMLMKKFGLGTNAAEGKSAYGMGVRAVRFQFEPMILHILTASLAHAQSVLAASINAGFRESGVQSLRNLDDTEACPMVAVRTSGLALESIIGIVEGEDEDGEETVRAMVDSRYLEMLVELANERFVANKERMERFSKQVSRLCQRDGDAGWEEKQERRARKRAEGLENRRNLHMTNGLDVSSEEDPTILVNDLFNGQNPT